MKYIVHRRFKHNAICGEVNLPVFTECESDGKFIFHNGQPLCCVTSANAHQYFACNDDGNGILRGKLTQAIQKCLAQRTSRDDPEHQARWDKVWDDPACQPYKREEHADYWLWNHDFFHADIGVLKHIAELIGVNMKEVSE